MARNDPYLPDFATVAQGGNVTFDGSASATGEAIVNEITGTFDCKIFIEESNNGGTSFTTVAQLSQQDGDLLFSASLDIGSQDLNNFTSIEVTPQLDLA